VTPANPSARDGRNRRLELEYDYMGRRIRKVGFAWNDSTEDWETAPDMDLRFVYDGWNLVQEIDGLVEVESGVTDVAREYTWGLDLSGQSGNPSPAGIHGAGGIGGLLATHWTNNTTSTSDDKAYIYFYDANGNVGQMIESTGSGAGTVAAKYEYYPFGGLLMIDGDAAETNPFRFSTKYRDNETGCYYNDHRYLRTKHGRWLNRDPISELDIAKSSVTKPNPSVQLDSARRLLSSRSDYERQLMLFCLNDPINLVDAHGLDPRVSCSNKNNRPYLDSSDPTACQYPTTARFSANFWMRPETDSDGYAICKPCGFEPELEFGVLDKPFWKELWHGKGEIQRCTRRVSWPISCVCKKMANSSIDKCMRGCLQCLYDADGNVPNQELHIWCATKCTAEIGVDVNFPGSLKDVINHCARSDGCNVGNGTNREPSPSSLTCNEWESATNCCGCDHCGS